MEIAEAEVKAEAIGSDSHNRHFDRFSLEAAVQERLDRRLARWFAGAVAPSAPETHAGSIPNSKTVTEIAGHALEPSPTVANFVKHSFIPEHVAVKRSAGRAHFYAILKHVLSPEELNQITGRPAVSERSKLVSMPDWPYIGKLPLNEVDTESIQRLVSAALHRGYSIQTATHIRNVVRSIFAHAATTGHHFGVNPASLVTLPAMSRREAHTLNLSQVSYLLHAMGSPERELALFTLLSDLGVAEICGLQWKYVNLSHSSVRAENEVIPPLTIAVRRQRYRGELDTTVGSRKRFVRTPQSLCSLLHELKTRSFYTSQDDFVLVSRKGTPLHPETIAARRLKAVGGAFGMEWLSWSVFRRTGIRLRSELGRSFHDHCEKLVFTLRSVAP
jgi:site-specific recombinase XerD